MLPMLITREGEEDDKEAFFWREGRSSWVRVKTRWRFRVRSLVQAASGWVSRGSPQAAPELLIRTSRPRGSRVVSLSARDLVASRDWRSAGRAWAVPPVALPVVVVSGWVGG